jgi:hypothetical protein
MLVSILQNILILLLEVIDQDGELLNQNVLLAPGTEKFNLMHWQVQLFSEEAARPSVLIIDLVFKIGVVLSLI